MSLSFRASRLLFTFFMIATLVAAHPLNAQTPTPEDLLIKSLVDLGRPLSESRSRFGYRLRAGTTAWAPFNEPRVTDPASGTDRKTIPHDLTIERLDENLWNLHLQSSWKEVKIVRSDLETTIFLPRQRVALAGRGASPPEADSLKPQGFLSRFISPETSLFGIIPLLNPAILETGTRDLLLPHLKPLPPLFGASASFPVSPGQPIPLQPDEFRWLIPGGHTLRLAATDPARLRLELASGSGELAGLKFIEVSLEASLSAPLPVASGDFIVTEIPRYELEKTIFRGLRRILALKLPGPAMAESLSPRKVPHGELRNHHGQVLVLLSGSPTEIGTAHGELLAPLVERTVDSTLYLVGLVETLQKGTWFQKDLDEAWTRLSPHLPAAQVAEIAALASACPRFSLREMRLANIFPEYFHCSGFALFGRSTSDGTLYHGRVLDYMTEIGLQHAAVTFVVKPQGRHGFINVGYAGFIGSVTGMNERQISLGEMGGGGRYKWDGMPMAALMRQALETCGTLDEVKALWATSPRTCEYYYVFADGKQPSAVGVKATPNELVFLDPGMPHPQLGEGIPDTIVLSVGKRLSHLRERILAGHGRFDASASIRLMDRPVAMRSNLHNALFIPQRLETWIAHADDRHPAAEQPYISYRLDPLLQEAAALSASPTAR